MSSKNAGTKLRLKEQSKQRDTCHPRLLSSMLLTDLPADMKSIYSHIIRRFYASIRHQRGGSGSKDKKKLQPDSVLGDVAIYEEADNATLTVQVSNKQDAMALRKRLNHATVCGRTWRVDCVPLRSIRCSTEACTALCTTVPATSRALVDRALRSVPGFLALADHPEADMENPITTTTTTTTTTTNSSALALSNEAHMCAGAGDEDDANERSGMSPSSASVLKQATDSTSNTRNNKNSHSSNNSISSNNSSYRDDSRYHADTTMSLDYPDVYGFGLDNLGPGVDGAQQTFLATFVDEGSVLHARAVLSGRIIGTSGVHLFIERHRA